MIAGLLTLLIGLQPQSVTVQTTEEIAAALNSARAGTTILVAPGEYRGGISASGVRGTKNQPITIQAQDPAKPPLIKGGGSGLQLSSCEYVAIRNLHFSGATGNGLNIDDGGLEGSTHHIEIQNVRSTDLPQGNHYAVKLSGVSDFSIMGNTLERWGGSGIDMVGCHRGVIRDCTFTDGGDSGIQAKGGSSEITVERCTFANAGQRGINIGGSTGREFFRPALAKMGAEKYEARAITVQGCTFIGGESALAFVGVDGATVRFNTVIDPKRWALRILQETRDSGFVPARNGVVEDNLFVVNGLSTLVNIGPNTAPETFQFRRNFWFNRVDPGRSKPQLPVAESDGIYGLDPQIVVKDNALIIQNSSPAIKVGAHAWKN